MNALLDPLGRKEAKDFWCQATQIGFLKRRDFDFIVTVVAPHSDVKARRISSLWGTEGAVSTQHLLISKQQLRYYLLLTVPGGPARLPYSHT